MLNRIDIHIEVLHVDHENLSSVRLGESSDDMRTRIESVCERQRIRFTDWAGIIYIFARKLEME